MKPAVTKVLIVLVCLIAVVGIDRITKAAARNNLKGKGTVQVVGNIVVLRYTENSGAFLGMGSKLPERLRFFLFILIPGVILVGVVIWLLFSKHITMVQLAALAAVLGGGVGNLFDRIYHGGYVADFINVGIGRLRTGIFNFADLAIMAGAVIFLVSSFRHKQW